MPITVKKLMMHSVQCCRTDQTVDVAAQIMFDNGCGCVPVLDKERKLVGMLTDRDICMAAYTQEQHLNEMPIALAMATPPRTIHESTSISEAIKKFEQYKVRRLPVVDNNDCVVGIVSLVDLVRYTVESTKTVTDFGGADILKTLATIFDSRDLDLMG